LNLLAQFGSSTSKVIFSKPVVGALNELFWLPSCDFLFFGRKGKSTFGFVSSIDMILTTTVDHSCGVVVY
jgi:hypothetical protein